MKKQQAFLHSLGQERTLAALEFMSAIPPITDIVALVSSSDPSQNNSSPADQSNARDITEPAASRDRLLQENENRNPCDPIKVHDTGKEQQTHQEPTAANAIGTVF